LKLSDAERSTLGEIGHRLGRTALAEVATVAKPDTILAWYRKLVAHKFDGSKARRGPGRPRVTRKVEQLIVRLAEENRNWGYDSGSFTAHKIGEREYHVVPPKEGPSPPISTPPFALLRHSLLQALSEKMQPISSWYISDVRVGTT
jgi:hypothetical protein